MRGGGELRAKVASLDRMTAGVDRSRDCREGSCGGSSSRFGGIVVADKNVGETELWRR